MPHLTKTPPGGDDLGDRLDRFEEAWRSQTPPSIEDFLPSSDASEQQISFDRGELLRAAARVDNDRPGLAMAPAVPFR